MALTADVILKLGYQRRKSEAEGSHTSFIGAGRTAS
jgi:hypothetical protein